MFIYFIKFEYDSGILFGIFYDWLMKVWYFLGVILKEDLKIEKFFWVIFVEFKYFYEG